MAAIQPPPEKPDFERLSVLLTELAAQVARIPNAAPSITVEELQATLQASLQNTSAEILDAVRATEERLTAKIDRVTAKIDRESSILMMRLHNSRCPHDAQLRYPAGLGENFPQTKAALYQIKGATCIQMAEALGMEPLANLPVDSRREKVIEYLGAI